jgi:hypothetical protein
MAWTVSWLGWRYLAAPSPEDAARSLAATQRVLLVSAEQDRFIPRQSSEVLWASIESSRARHDRLLMPGDHLQPGSDALIAEITDRVLIFMKAGGLL